MLFGDSGEITTADADAAPGAAVTLPRAQPTGEIEATRPALTVVAVLADDGPAADDPRWRELLHAADTAAEGKSGPR